MNRIIKLVLIIFLVCGLGGCAQNESKDDDTVTIVTTIYPLYDWSRSLIAGNENNIELNMLINSGVDLHSYQPTAEDIMKISTCDLFIYVGGESDEWVDDALKQAVNKEMVVIDLMDVLKDKIKEEEVIEGMEAEEEGEEHEEETEYDEHVWLSLNNARDCVETITNGLIQIDDNQKDLYTENKESYLNSLNQLDEKYKDMRNNIKRDTVLFADRFPFRYLFDDYDINYYAAFVGCSAETEASFETIRFLSEKTDELDLNSLIIIENSSDKIAKTIMENSSREREILTMNSLQSVSDDLSYLEVMEENLEVLRKALS